MRTRLILLCIFVSACLLSEAQSSRSVNDAFLITRMAEKFHFQPRTLNDDLSSKIFTQILKQLDDDKLFFTADDVKALSKFQFELDDEIKNKKATFLMLLTEMYSNRIAK